MEMHDEIHVAFMLAKTTSILQPRDQGVIFNFKSYYLRNTLYKAIAAIDSDSSDGSEQSQLETFWKGFTSLDASKNICDSWEEVEISALTGVWKKLIPSFMGDFRGSRLQQRK